MSYDCGNALRGWCRSFTNTERWLTVLEAIFLVVFISFLTFLILHLLACSCSVDNASHDKTTSSEESIDSTEDSIYSDEFSTIGTESTKPFEKNTTDGRTCSWTPSFKTETVTSYYLNEWGGLQTQIFKKMALKSRNKSNYLLLYDTPDEVDIDTAVTGLILALVRVQPFAFGCILSVISAQWTVTSASCIDSIEFLHHHQRFVMIGDQIDVRNGYKVSDVKMHPKYRSNSTHYDLCALKSIAALGKEENFLTLPTPIDYLITVIGNRLTAFGYRRSRSAGAVRAVAVRAVSGGRCPGGRGAVCAGRRGGACGAGSPLLRGRRVLAVRAGRGTGDCAPAAYRSLAPHAHWLRSLDRTIKYLL